MQAVAAGKQHLVLADHSGSGKTLAYLVPLTQQLRLQEAGDQERWAKPRRPSVLVVLPTNELAVQVSPHSAAFLRCRCDARQN